MNKKRNLWILIFLILTLLGYWAYLALRPQVLAVYPLDGVKNIKANSEIKLSFSLPMQKETLEEYIKISPSVEGSFSWQDNELTFKPSENWPEGADIQVVLDVGAKSALGLKTTETIEWTFKISNTRLAYLWPMGLGANLYLLDVSSGDTQQISTSKGLLDFDVDELNSLIYYSAINGQGGSDLFVLDYYFETVERILACGNDYCSNVQVSYSGEQLAFEKSGKDGVGSVWMMPLDGDAKQISEDGHIADTAQWSPDGRLVYYDRTEKVYHFVDQSGEQVYQLENITGEPGTWSVTGLKFVLHEHFPFSTSEELGSLELFSSHILSLNTNTEQLVNLSGEDDYIEDTEPSFSPDGHWLAYARTDLDSEEVVIGRPMWIMRSDGTQQRYLLGDPNFRHSAFAWHPDGEQIAFLRFNTIMLTEPPEIWLTNVSDSSAFRLVIGGFDPKWTP